MAIQLIDRTGYIRWDAPSRYAWQKSLDSFLLLRGYQRPIGGQAEWDRPVPEAATRVTVETSDGDVVVVNQWQPFVVQHG